MTTQTRKRESEKGQTMTEYALILTAVGIVGFTAYSTLTSELVSRRDQKVIDTYVQQIDPQYSSKRNYENQMLTLSDKLENSGMTKQAEALRRNAIDQQVREANVLYEKGLSIIAKPILQNSELSQENIGKLSQHDLQLRVWSMEAPMARAAQLYRQAAVLDEKYGYSDDAVAHRKAEVQTQLQLSLFNPRNTDGLQAALDSLTTTADKYGKGKEIQAQIAEVEKTTGVKVTQK